MKRIIYLMVFLVLVSSVNGLSKLCYQETANDSSVTSTNPTFSDGDCGLKYTGSYGCYGGFYAGEECENIYDGDWNTFGSGSDADSTFYINYTKPSFALSSSKWQIKYWFGFDDEITENFTLPSDCWNQSLLQFKMLLDGIVEEQGFFYCLNDTDWELLSPTEEPAYIIYEESMWWNVSTRIQYRFGFMGWYNWVNADKPKRFGFKGFVPTAECPERPCRFGIRGYVDENSFT